MYKIITVAAVGVALACSAHAESFFHVEAGLGVTAFNTASDDLWYQQGFEHKLRLYAPAIRLGVTGDALPYSTGSYWPGVAWHADYVYLGRASATSVAAPDPNGAYAQSGGYSTATHSCMGECGPLRHFQSSGNLNGVSLTLEPFWRKGNWRFGVEAGPFFYRSTWHATATSLTDTQWWGPAGSVEHLDHTPSIEIGLTVGASVAYKDFSLSYNFYNIKTHKVTDANVPPIWNKAHMVMLNYRF